MEDKDGRDAILKKILSSIDSRLEDPPHVWLWAFAADPRFISSAHGKSIIAKLASVSSQVEKIVGQCALRGELGE